MIVTLVSLTTDPKRRAEHDKDIGDWMDSTRAARSAAIKYDFLVNPADPSQVHFLQVWPSREDADSFEASEEHATISRILDKGYYSDMKVYLFDGYTDELQPAESVTPDQVKNL